MRNTYYNRDLISRAQMLRLNLTPAEQKLWWRIRGGQILGLTFYCQAIVQNFIVDFFAPEAKLIIEVDGADRFEQYKMIKDQVRDQFLKSLGFQVLRYHNGEIMRNINDVLEDICNEIQAPFQIG